MEQVTDKDYGRVMTIKFDTHGQPISTRAISLFALITFSVPVVADQFDADVCNSMRDKDERKGCIIRVMGYSEAVCNMYYPQSREQLLCLSDVERFEAIGDPCRKGLECYAESEMVKARKVMSLVLKKPGSAFTPLGDPSKVPEMTVLHWINPGRGDVAYEVGRLGVLKWGPKGMIEFLQKRRLK